MNMTEFISDLKFKDKGEITLEDCKRYYHYFKDMDEDRRTKLLGKETRLKIGEALKIYRENALIQWKLGRKRVELPIGADVVCRRDPKHPSRVKYENVIPIGTSRGECIDTINRLLDERPRSKKMEKIGDIIQ